MFMCFWLVGVHSNVLEVKSIRNFSLFTLIFNLDCGLVLCLTTWIKSVDRLRLIRGGKLLSFVLRKGADLIGLSDFILKL